jgi:hypothetical protein
VLKASISYLKLLEIYMSISEAMCKRHATLNSLLRPLLKQIQGIALINLNDHIHS